MLLFEMIIVAWLVKKFLTCFGTRSFITVFIRTCHWSLPWVIRTQSI